MNYKAWFKAAGIRAIKTFAQALIGAIGAAYMLSEVQWVVALSAAGLATLLSFLTSVAGLPELDVQGGEDNGD